MRTTGLLLRWSGKTNRSLRRAVSGILALVVAVLVFSSGADAANEQWKYYGTNQKSERFFYDAASVMRISADLIHVWTRELTSEGAAKRLEEINCSYKVMRDLQVIYEGKQKPLVRPRTPSGWKAMEQDPVTQELHKVLCR